MTSFDFNYLPKFLYPNAGTLSVRVSTKEFHKSTILSTAPCCRGFPGGSEVKASACNVGDPGPIPGSGRSPGEGNGNPLQYSFLENPMDRGAWSTTIHGVTDSDKTEQLTHTHTHS